MTIRCAIYTRKSTEEGLEQEFNSLDAQRESAENYIASQKHAGWACLPDRYDDGGYTGGNMERPAMQRLLKDIQAGKVDCVVVYKVDRLSRSLLDFARVMEVFEKHRVSFVSVTQQFNTTTSMGRLMLNVLLSFAQFEREIISERTRDKIAATRRKGKWSGGRPVLGYDVAPGGGKLVVNENEARRVREIFELYLEQEGLVATVGELNRRGWTTKHWTTHKSTECGGNPFNKNSLFNLLTNVIYLGKITYKEEAYKGEHTAIVDAEVFNRVQGLLKRNGRSGGAQVRNQFGALLKGLLYCVPCGCRMVPTHTTKGHKRYRYYVCSNAQKRGWDSCPSKSIPAGEIERFVADQIKGLAQDPSLIAETLHQVQQQGREKLAFLQAEQESLKRELSRHHEYLRDLARRTGPEIVDHLADVQERMAATERQLTEIGEQMAHIQANLVQEGELHRALREFTPVWQTLSPREQARLLRLLIKRIDYDGRSGELSIAFHPAGIKTLALENQEDVA